MMMKRLLLIRRVPVTLRTPTAAALLTVCITSRDSLTFYPTLPLRGHYALPLLLTITVGDITFGRRMRQNKTLSIIENVRQNINSVIPIHSYSPEQRNKDKNWINNCAEPERWLNDQDNHPLKLDNIERSNIKWMFVKFSNIEVKAVFDRQPHRASARHSFLIKEIKNLAKLSACVDYHARITKSCNLQRHDKSCAHT